MATTIKLKNSVTTTNAPSSLVQGEVAINITDKKVWVGNAATTPVQLLGDGGSASFTSIAFGAGTVSSPSITFTGDTNTGIYSPAADTIAFTEGGVESMRIDSSGSVQIGTTTSLSGAAKSISLNSTSDVEFALGISGTKVVLNYADATQYITGTATAIPYIIRTNNTERMRITSAGDLLLGTTSSTGGKFHMQGNYARLTDGTYTGLFGKGSDLIVGGGASDLGIRSDAAILFSYGSTERMRIDSSGNVAIGRTSSISYKLDVDAGAGSAARLLSNNAQVLIGYNSTSFNYYDADTQIFRNNAGTERMRIDSSGNVGIGTSSPASKLNVASSEGLRTTNDGGFVSFYNTANTTRSGYLQIQAADIARLNVEANQPLVIFTNSTERMRITSGGTLLVGTTSSGSGTNPGITASSGADTIVNFVYNSLAGYASSVSLDATNRSANSGFNFYAALSGRPSIDNPSGQDSEFILRGDGNGYADGTWNNNGADYAEYFESATGQSIPVGSTVVLENNKVRVATESDNPADVIGVVRPKEPSKASMVVGNTAWNKWANKYLTDDFDRYIMEDHNVVEWTDEEGKEHSYESHNIPSSVVVPSDAIIKTHDDKGNKFQHYKLNPAWNKDVEYINRENRDEWLIIGLVGQVKVFKGQIMGERWKKMRDVSPNVQEWFIR